MNVRLTLEYDGTGFHGWQLQPGRRTVQGVIQEALARIVGQEVEVIGAGRTDAGVHAEGQVANFRAETRLAPEVLRRGLNALLPDDVVVTGAGPAPDAFHSRFDAIARSYRYTLSTRPRAIGRCYSWYVPARLDLCALRQAASRFAGRRNFASFCNTAGERTGHTCTVMACDWVGADGTIALEVTADRFLRGMVRTMVGTMVEVGRGRLGVDAIEGILTDLRRSSAGPTAPACGLCLMRVAYRSEDGGGESALTGRSGGV